MQNKHTGKSFGQWVVMTSLGIKFTIAPYKNPRKKHKSSSIRLSSKQDCKKLGNYIYQGENFGLARKRKRWEIINLNNSHGNHNPDNRSIDIGVDPQNFFPIAIEDAINIALAKKIVENHPNRKKAAHA